MELRRLGIGDEKLLDHALEVLAELPAVDAASFLADPNAVVIVATTAGAPVGWSWGRRIVRPDGRPMFLLYELEVELAHRNQRIGRALVEETKAIATELGCVEMWLVTEANNASAISMYRAAGGTWSDDGDLVISWDLTD